MGIGAKMADCSITKGRWRGDPTKSKSHVAFRTDTLLSNDDLIHRWIADMLDSTLGSHPELTSTTVGIQGNMAVVQNMSGQW